MSIVAKQSPISATAELLCVNSNNIKTVTKDTSFQAYIRLLAAAAPSDSAFFVRWAQIDLLSYLLTYSFC